MEHEEPKLFLDVSGCLLVDKDPGGYVSFEYKGKTYWHDQDTPERFRELDKPYDIRWASHSWRGKDAEWLAKYFGIDTIPTALDYEVDERNRDNNMWPEKLEAIKKTYDGPAAVIDDRMGPAVQEWAHDKTVLLINPDHKIGVTGPMFNLLLSFGEMFRAKSVLVEDFMEVSGKKAGLVYANGEWW